MLQLTRDGNVRAHTEGTVLTGGARGQRPEVQQETSSRRTRNHRDDQRERAPRNAHLPVPGHRANGQIGRFLVFRRHRRE